MKAIKINYLKKILLFLFLIIAINLLFFSYYAFTFVIVAILPTLITFLINKKTDIYAINTLGTLNLTALLPFIFQLCNTENLNDTAKILMYSPQVWFIIYSIVGLGYCAILTLPHLCGKGFEKIAEKRIIFLEQRKEKILNEWNFDKNNKA